MDIVIDIIGVISALSAVATFAVGIITRSEPQCLAIAMLLTLVTAADAFSILAPGGFNAHP